jgi:exosortase A-associated hydrolase 1
MTRRHITFACAGETLIGTLDDAPGAAGLLIVSGGNEIRSGAFAGQTQIAAQIAGRGFPVFRFDRRGVGDSSGDNRGFRHAAPDIAAAIAAFRQQCPAMARLVIFGNCDAASALMLAGGAGADALVLANPWTFDGDAPADAIPPAAIRARYAARLKDPREWLRLLRGGVSLRKLARGLGAAAAAAPPSSGLLGEMREGWAQFAGETRFLIAGQDRTGITFAALWPGGSGDIAHCAGADHAFSGTAEREWLISQIASALHEQAGQFDMR